MPISLTCPQCSAPLNIKEQFAGKRGKCPRCQGLIDVPGIDRVPATESASLETKITSAAEMAAAKTSPSSGRASTSADVARHAGVSPPPAKGPVAMPVLKAPQRPVETPLSPQELEARVLGGFTGPIPRVRTSLLYRLGIALATTVMVLLPLIYVALIALVAWGVYWHMVNNVGIVGSVRGRGAIFTLLIYLAPLIVGGILIVFMVKPLFAAPARRGRTRSLTRDSDPLLFAFVAKICETVRAPMPKRIDIDHQINASAGFRRGLLSFLGRDLVLTIGMPLAGGLSLQQFAGVLAHEFGHFSQGAGMRLTYIVRAISNWFLRVVYERDSWDEWLASSTDELDLRIAWVLYLAKACVWLTRRVLWLLMYVGHLVAGFMLRQMEFDADRYEARLAGSDSFAATVRQLHLLNLAQERAQSDFGFFFREGRLADNLPKLILVNSKQMPSEAHQFINKLIAESHTSLFDTHPSDKDRVASAEAERAPGVFRSELPATVLFRNFDAAARNVTWDFYCDIFETMVPQSSLVPVDDLLKRTDEEQAVADARKRFFLDTFQALRPLRFPSSVLAPASDMGAVQDELADARQQMGLHAAAYKLAYAKYDQCDTQLVEALQFAAIYRGGVRPRLEGKSSALGSSSDAARARDRAQDAQGLLDRELEPFEIASGRRLVSALTLLADRRTAQRLEGGESLRKQAQTLLPIAGLIASHLGSVVELRNRHAVLAALLAHIDGNESNESLVTEIIDAMKRTHQQLADVRSLFTHESYPFDHAKGELTIAQYLIEMTPPSDDLGAITSGVDRLLTNVGSLYARAVGRLAMIGEKVEEDLALPPLEASDSSPTSAAMA